MALLTLPSPAYADEPTCTAQPIQARMMYDRDPPSVARVNARPRFEVPPGTPTCVFIGFNANEPPPSTQIAERTMVAALRHMCTPEREEAMRIYQIIVEGTCTFDDGTVVQWRAQPRPPQ